MTPELNIFSTTWGSVRRTLFFAVASVIEGIKLLLAAMMQI
jgi:hypothetical protein